MINNFIKSSSNSNGKTVPVYFLLEDETGEFLSSEYKIDFIFNEELKSKVDETIKKSIAEQDKVILDTRKWLLQQYKDNKKNNIYLYDFSDNMVEIAINKSKNEIDLFGGPFSFAMYTAGTGLKRTLTDLSNINYINSIRINTNPDTYDKSNIKDLNNTNGLLDKLNKFNKVKNFIEKEFGIKDTSMENFIDKSFNLNLYSSNNKIKFKRTLKVLITNNFEKLKNELEKIDIK